MYGGVTWLRYDEQFRQRKVLRHKAICLWMKLMSSTMGGHCGWRQCFRLGSGAVCGCGRCGGLRAFFVGQ